MKSAGGVEMVGNELQGLESSLESIVDDLVKSIEKGGTKKKGKGKKGDAYGAKQMQDTYLELCRNSLSPIVRYIKAMNSGVLSKDIIEVMSLIVNPLVNKTKQVGLEPLARKLKSFQVVVQGLEKSKTNKITVAQSASLFEVYWPLHEAFKLEMRGHSLAVANLLSFYRKLKRLSSVTPADIRKLFAIGIPSLTMIRKSTLEDLSSLSGISQDRIAEIRKLAREFQLEWYMG